ncbi:hypothetical protein OHB00_26830 [Streptomyces sp. NBC_00631]|uniref:hypothetical protein n=1 Tax=Streptomyces sp. NBC_00631 TaxID=2975793 RepID=UPI0030E06386
MSAGRRRAVLLLATLATFGTALAGSYALTGLWTAQDSADRWAIAIAFAVAASGAVDKAVSPWADQAVPPGEPPGALAGGPARAPSGPAPSGDPSASPAGDPAGAPSGPPPAGDLSGSPGGEPQAGDLSGSPGGEPQAGDPSGSPGGAPSGRTPEPSGPRRRVLARDRVTTAVVAVALTATASGIVYGAVAPDKGHADTASSVSKGYTRVYADRRLFLKDYHYYFDLRAGRSSRSETEWSISTNAGGDGDGAFEIPPLTDAYVVPGKAAPSAAQCAAKAVHHPAEDRLHFRDSPPGRAFCLRDTVNGDIAVVKVLDVDTGNYSTTDTVTYYRHDGRALADHPD